MPFMETGGGAAGGAARGLQAGLSLGAGLYDKAAERQIQRQDQELRREQMGLEQRASDRADREELQKNTEFRLGLLNSQLQDLEDRGAGAAQQYGMDSPQAQSYLDQIRQTQEEIGRQRLRYMAPQVYDGVVQAQKDAASLRNNEMTPDELGPVRFSHVLGLTGHPAISFVDGYDPTQTADDGSEYEHNGQRGPISGAVNDVHNSMQVGNYIGAHQAAFPLLAPYTSPHPPGHDLHYPGLNTPYADSSLQAPDLSAMGGPGQPQPVPTVGLAVTEPAPAQQDTNAAIGHGLNTIGALGVTSAAINSHPDARKLVIDGHKQGATNDFLSARNFLMQVGGFRNIPQWMAPDQLDQRFEAYKNELVNSGMAPDKAAVKAREEIFTPQIVSERMRIAAEGPLREAQVARDKAMVDLYRQRGRQPLLGNDGRVYVQDPETGGYVDSETGEPKPLDVQLAKPGAAPAQKPIVREHTTFDSRGFPESAPIVIQTDQSGNPVSWHSIPQSGPSGPMQPAAAGPQTSGSSGGGEPPAQVAPKGSNVTNPLINPQTGRYWGQ